MTSAFDEHEGHDPKLEEAALAGPEDDVDEDVTDETDEAGSDDAEETEEPEGVDGLPAGNASRKQWEAYALAHGSTPEALEGLGRDAIRDLYL